jgi:hypothetical protein
VTRRQQLRSSAASVLVLALMACRTEAAKPTAGSATPSAPPPAPSATPEKPWYEGSWSGEYSAKLFKVESGPGAVKEWIQDDGAKSSGPGKLTLRIDGDGAIQGQGEGALGPLEANGRVDGDTLRVTLRATGPATADGTGFFGLLLGNREGDAIKARLQASTGNSLTVREASLELKKSP